MRRKDREMDQAFAMYVIDKARFGVVSMIDQQQPYALPLSVARKGEFLYFHSARSGRKTEILQDGDWVSVAFVCDVQVPDLYSEDQLAALLEDASGATKLVSSVFTTEFASAIVLGKIERVEDEIERVAGMRAICEKFTPDKMKYFDVAAARGLPQALIYRISMVEITAKRKKYDSAGLEMKYMRGENS
jgi:nitroimidazol reductase NimA-like FMN-containing flavoprotein (pyridoxamine 5'-phosphate oxidase superfamily)